MSCTLNDKNLILKLSIDQIIRLEQDLQKGILKIAQDIANGHYGITEIEAILCYAMPKDSSLSREKLKISIFEGGIAYYASICAELLALSLQGKYEQSKKEMLPT